MLKGQAKRDYQREYMRKKRSNTGLTGGSNKGLTDKLKAQGLTLDGNKIVQPKGILGRIGRDPNAKYPELDADGNVIYEEG